jgi:predicted porin
MYNLGFATVGLGYDGASTEGTTALPKTGAVLQSDKSATAFSITAPMGPVSLGLEYFKRGESKETNIGGMYAFSKRTDFTVAYGEKKFPMKAASGFLPVTQDNQYRVSLRHKF